MVQTAQQQKTATKEQLTTHDLARFSPAGLAAVTTAGSGKPWILYPHLAVINAALVRACRPRASRRERRIICSVPPQVGKSSLISHRLPPWFLGTYPERRVALASYEAKFASSWGRKARDLMEEWGQELWGLSVRDDSSAADDWNLAGHEGGMTTCGIGGPLTGKHADLAIVEDPVKNMEEALSETTLQMHWDWFESTLETRLGEDSILIIVMTRWSPNDLVGKIKDRAKRSGEEWTEITMPALELSDVAVTFLDGGPWTRQPGESICEPMYSRQHYEATRARITPYIWSGLYEQNPIPREGKMFKTQNLGIVDLDDVEIGELEVARAWDLAATAGGGASTVGFKMGRHPKTKTLYILDLIEGQWDSGVRDARILATAHNDGFHVAVLPEQEPGSGGKTQVESIARLLQGFNCIAAKTDQKSKVLRADPFSSAVNTNQVRMIRAPWNDNVRAAMDAFPMAGKDIVDAGSHAFNHLCAGVYMGGGAAV